MSFGSTPFASAPFGSAGGAFNAEREVTSLGNVANFGGPYSARHDSLHDLASFGYLAAFGGPLVGSNVHGMRSLGVVAQFGQITTPGNTLSEILSFGCVARFGHCAAVLYLGYAAGPHAPPGGVTLVDYATGPYVPPPGITFIGRAPS